MTWRDEEPDAGFGDVPERFNFTRDVIEPLAANPVRPALTTVSRDGVIDRQTFTEVASDASRWANLLRAHGLEEGDRLLVQVGRVPGWHAVLLGALKIGAVAVPCSEMLRSKDLAFRAAHSGARLLVSERSAEQEVALMEPQIATLFLDEAQEELRSYPAAAVPANTRAGDPALILYTSGTTKDPRGVVHTHAYTWAKRFQAEHWLDAQPDDLVWCTAGTGWAKAIWNVLLGPWSRGAEVVVHDGAFDPVERFDLIVRLGVNVLCQSPTEYRLMAKVDGLDELELPRLRHAVSAGEPLNPEVIKAFSAAFGIVIHDGYGQTENTLLVANLPGSEIRPGSMGRPTSGHVVHVIDETGARVAPGTEGDIALLGRPPSLFTGYWNDAAATSATFRGEYYVTGDRASVDADGYFWFTGRADDVILSAGYRIGPFEVESALLAHPAVAESAVIGKPDADRGQIVKAFVVLRPEFDPAESLASELREHVKAVTAPYKYPREIEFVESLPKTSSGKIRRVELRALELERTEGPPTIVTAAALPLADTDELARARALRRVDEAAHARDQAERADEERREAERLAAAESEAALQETARLEAEREDEERRREESREAARVEAQRAETERRDAEALAAALLAAERREEEERLDAGRHEAERQEAARAEAARQEAGRHEALRVEAERAEAARQAAERLEAERREGERREAEAAAAALLAAERLEAERRDAERVEVARREAEGREAERLEAERVAAERLEADRREAERLEAQRADAERAEAERREAERQEAVRVKAERQEAARLEAERLEAERAEAARAEAERVASEHAEAERVEADRREAERLEAERQEAAHIEAELQETRRQEAERRAARQLAEEQRDAEVLAAKRGEAERMRTERLRGEQRLLDEREERGIERPEAPPAPRVETKAPADAPPAPVDDHDRAADESLINRLRAYRMHDKEPDDR